MIVRVVPSTTPDEELNERASPSISLADNSRVKDVSSSIVCPSMIDKTGASLIGETCNVKLPEPDA